MARWEDDFERWADDAREGEWYWEVATGQVATSFGEWQRLNRAPLPKVAKWARIQGREVS
jgi:hypothetical protein